MFSGVKTFFRNWLRLLFWFFFKPTALRAHLRQIAPELPEARTLFRELRQAVWGNQALRHFLWQALLATVLTTLILGIAIRWLVTPGGGNFDWMRSLIHAALAMAVGVTSGVAFSVGSIMAVGLVSGVAGALGSAVAMAGVETEAFSVTLGVGFGMLTNILYVVLLGTALGVSSGMVFGVVIVVVFGVAHGVEDGVAFGVGYVVSFLRVPLYLFEATLALRAYQREKKSTNPTANLMRSPVFFDDFLILPQPFLASFLVTVARTDLSVGLCHIARVANNPLQRWASQRALRSLLEREKIPYFQMLNHLLTNPEPYAAIESSPNEHDRTNDPYFTTKLLLAELAGVVPIPGFGDTFARWFTGWLRMRGQSPFAQFAEAYFKLLNHTAQPVEVLAVFESARSLSHGEEVYHIFRLAIMAQRCQNLAVIAKCQLEFASLFAIEVPLRPGIITVFRCLNDATTDATAFLTVEHPASRRNALFKAFSALEQANNAAEDVYEPEQSILLEVVKQWRSIFENEGLRGTKLAEVVVLPNPYIAGRALGPKDGKLFVDRREVFRQIEETLHNGVTVVLYGQRRIGKTSILMRLHEHFPHCLLPVYLNLQRMQAETTAGLFFTLAQDIAAQLRRENWPAPVVPTHNEFLTEPFLTFNAFLQGVEHGLQQPDQRVVLAFDEFEELEKQVNTGRIDQRIFSFLRGVTQTGRGFVLVFAGFHTLEQMTRDYWHPFFLSVKPIKVTYFSEAEAWQLITDPVDEFPLQYDNKAVERIIAITHGQPYLVQDLCHNLVNYLNAPLHRSNRATGEAVNAVLERTLESGTYYFDDYVWGWSNDNERLALAAIADEGANTEGGWVTFTIIEKHLGREIALATVKNLCARDILEERAAGAILEYRFQVELSRLWVARTQPLARILLEQGKC